MPLGNQDHLLAQRVTVSVIASGGDVVGAGFLVGPDLVATCAHVVASAADADPYAAEPPSDPIRLDFPMLGAATRAVVHRWLPIAEDGTGDVAVLKLLDPPPPGSRMPPLRRVDQLWDQHFRVLGFPEGMADGVWTTGRIRGVQGTRWFQLQTAVGDQPIVEGFSGAPVWHDETGAVVGMTVAADASGRTTTAYLIPVEQVLGSDPELLPCPYRGLEPFGEEHAEFFFGREGDIAALASAVATHPLVAVTGPSGVGKSSLVGAGLVPRLRAEGIRIAQFTPLPGHAVDAALSAALAGADGPGADGAAGAGRTVLVIDQFEELAAAAPDSARQLLGRIGELVTADDPIGAVLTLRSATLDEVLVPELAGLLGAGTVLVPPMQRGQLRDAIVAPAERAPGLSFEAGLVDRILDDAAAGPGQLPLVESLLTELWARRDGGYLTLRAYEDAGGVAGVIATHAESVLAAFTEPGDGPRLRRLLTSLASPDRDGTFVRTSLTWTDVAADLRPTVHRLAAGRLVVVARDATGTEHVQLAHQALIAHWPRLRDWLTEDRDFLAWRAQLDQQRERWERADRDDGALLRGTPLSTALDWLPARSADLPEAGRDYVRRSRARQRREVRRWRTLTAVLAVLVVVAGTLSVVAVTRGDRISDQLRRANAELVAQSAIARAGFDPVAATQLALTAWHLDPDNGSARTALINQYLAMRSVDAVFPGVDGGGLDAIIPDPDGADRVLARNGTGYAVIEGLTAGRPARWDVPTPADARLVGFTDLGKTIIALGPGGEIMRWDAASHTALEHRQTGIATPEIGSTTMDLAATRVAWLRPAGPGVQALELRDARTGAALPHRIDPIAAGSEGVGITFPLDPSLALLEFGIDAAEAGPLVVRSLADGAVRSTFPPGSVAASTTSGTVLSCEQDGTRSVAVLRTLANAAEVRRFALLSNNCSGAEPLRVSTDGDHLIEVSWSTGPTDSRTVRITRLTDGHAYGLALPPDSRSGNSLNPRLDVPMAVTDGFASATVLLAHGSSILRLRAQPLPASPDTTLWPVDDDRYVVSFDQNGTAVFDRGLARIAGLTHAQAGTSSNDGYAYTASGLVVVAPQPDGWTVTDLALPTLARRSAFRLPPAPRRPSVAVLDDRVLTISAHEVTAWDRATGEPLYEPTRLPDSGYPDTPSFAVRPGHPDKVVITTDLAAAVWDLRQRRQIADVPRTGSLKPIDMAFTPAGDRLVSSTLGGNLEVRDADTLQPARPAFPAPGTVSLVGVTRDGYAMTMRDDTVYRAVFWDVDRAAESGSFALPNMYRLSDLSGDGRYLRISASYGTVPFNLPVTAGDWAARLCAFADGPFTEQVRALLPQGVEADRPCPAA